MIIQETSITTQICIGGSEESRVELVPCDGKTYVAVFPLTNSVISVVVRGQIKTFTYEQAQQGTLTLWVNSIFLTPCPVSVAAAQTQTQVATNVATAAANAAAIPTARLL